MFILLFMLAVVLAIIFYRPMMDGFYHGNNLNTCGGTGCAKPDGNGSRMIEGYGGMSTTMGGLLASTFTGLRRAIDTIVGPTSAGLGERRLALAT